MIHPSDNVNYGAGPTGGLDDVDDWYSGKSGANPEDDKGKVRKTYAGGVRPDHMDFESIAREKALAQKPAICCPNCQNPVKELDSARPQYEKPELVEGEPPWAFVLHPCGCKVSSRWAGAFTAELNRRIAGGVPLPVADLDPEEAAARVQLLEERITNTLAKLDTAEGEAAKRLQYYLVIDTDALAGLVPLIAARIPWITTLDPEVETWAADNKMKTPPKKSSEFGYPPGYKNPLTKTDADLKNSVAKLCGPGAAADPVEKEIALHLDPVVAAAGKEQLKRQQLGSQIVKLGGMLSRRTLAEVFNIDISTEQEALAKEMAAKGRAVAAVSDLGHSDPALYPGLATKPVGPAPWNPPWDRSLLTAAREFLDKHNMLCLQLINEQILHQPHHETRHAASWLVTIKQSIDTHLKLGKAMSQEAQQLLFVIIPVLMPATGMVPTKPGPSAAMPLPVSGEELKEDFHAQFAPARRRIVRPKGDGE